MMFLAWLNRFFFGRAETIEPQISQSQLEFAQKTICGLLMKSAQDLNEVLASVETHGQSFLSNKSANLVHETDHYRGIYVLGNDKGAAYVLLPGSTVFGQKFSQAGIFIPVDVGQDMFYIWAERCEVEGLRLSTGWCYNRPGNLWPTGKKAIDQLCVNTQDAIWILSHLESSIRALQQAA